MDADHSPFVELLDGASSGVGEGTAHSSDDRVDEVFDPGTVGVEIETTRTDALFEEGPAGSF